MFQECRHIKNSGTKCQAPALKGADLCYFHGRSREHAKRHVELWAPIQIPLLEDRSAIAIRNRVTNLWNTPLEPVV